jgi:hypothetical protein
MKALWLVPLVLLGLGLGVTLGAAGPANAGAAAGRVADADFDWSTASYDPANGGFCNAAGWCAAPGDSIPPQWAADCHSVWCAYPSNALCIQLGVCGGAAGEGRSCDWLPENCFMPVSGVTPPTAEECEARSWAVCDHIGGGDPGGPVVDQCPLDLAVSQPAPLVMAAKLAPEFPVVVGQDEEARGVDLAISAQVFPVTASYNTWVEVPEHICIWRGEGEHGGCSQRGYDSVLGNGGVWESWMIGHPDWAEETRTRRECQRTTRSYQDRIGTVTVQARLTDESINWISNHLAGIYPGARVYQPTWYLWPPVPPAPQPRSGGLSADRTSLALNYEAVPLADPGSYRIVIAGWTTGTYFSAPRRISFDEVVFHVDVKLTALTR